MKNAEEEKHYFVERVKKFLRDLEVSVDPFDIEAQVYLIKTLSESAHIRLHRMNASELAQ